MLVILMFSKNDKNKKTNYQSFDSWLSNAKKSINDFKEEVERELEEEEKNSKNIFESAGKGTAYRKFSDNKDLKEIFPSPQSSKTRQTIMDKKSHEGKVNSKGSISGSPIMGREGDPVNPDLRRRLEEKRRREMRASRDKNKSLFHNDDYKRKSVKTAEKSERVESFKNSLKDKESFRKAILASEVLGPPISKRKNH